VSCGREIAQEGGEILPKVLPKVLAELWKHFVSPKIHKSCN